MRNRWLGSAAIVALLAGAGLFGVACSSDDADETPVEQPPVEETDAGGETDSGETDSGETETDGGTDAAPDGKDEEDDEPGSEACGTVTCEGVTTALGFGLDGCCAVEADEACGLIVPAPIGNDSCVALNQPGNLVEEEVCPEYDLATESGISALPALPGCCTPAGTCGYATTGTALETLGINLGCVDPADIGVEIEGDPKTCTYVDPGEGGEGGAGGEGGEGGAGGEGGEGEGGAGGEGGEGEGGAGGEAGGGEGGAGGDEG